jgi:hydroxyethylthiazole kinase-like uncharacterized protein yjeF
VIQAHDVATVRAAEAELMALLPAGALMRRAAVGLATTCARTLGRVSGARVVVLAGSGSNGGDALHAGAWLARRGARVDAVLLSSRTHEQGLADLRRAGGGVLSILSDPTSDHPALERAAGLVRVADLVLDGIVGIGGSGALRPDAARLVAAAADAGGLLVAVDVPSGVDASTGEVAGAAVRADLTVTFGTHKPGLLIDPGGAYAGSVSLVDIGLGPHLGRRGVEVLEAEDVADLLPVPAAESDKYSRGVVGVVAGSDQYPGAAVLCAGGAVRAGAGMVRYAGPDHAADLVRARWPEVVVGQGRVQAWTLGSGLGEGPEARGRIEQALASDQPAVVDADGLRHLTQLGHGRCAPTLLTPHAGELARLLDVDRSQVEAKRLHHARHAAEHFGATVLLKGSTTVVADPGGAVRVNATGTPWLATAGTGDVLAGICGALLAGGLGPLDAGSVGAWLHGMAARLVARDAPLSAGQLCEEIPAAWRSAG